MKKNFLFVLLILFVLAVYLNRAYAYFYYSIGHRPHLEPPHPVVTTITPTEHAATSNLTYVAIGDSLTTGVGVGSILETFPYLVATHMANTGSANVTFVNVGIPGATAQTVLTDEIPKALAYHPDIVTVLVGVNDMHNRVPLAEFKNKVQAIVRAFPSTTKVYVMTAPALGSATIALPPYGWYFDAKTRSYNAAIVDALAGTSATVIDLYSVHMSASRDWGDAYYAPDEFHPSALGYSQWSSFLYDRIHR